jgi:hypothetical protein
MADYTKPFTIPQWALAAGCSATFNGTGNGQTIAYTPTATPGPGLCFLFWEFRAKYTFPNDPSRDYVDPPYGSEPFRNPGATSRFVEYFYNDEQKEFIDIVAVFGTNLLLNSYDSTTPVGLVHDPETNRLVAAY